MTKQRYKILAGVHYEPNTDWDGKSPHDPTRYSMLKAGDVVESERDLSAVFPGKFERVPEGTTVVGPISDERRAIITRMLTQGKWGEQDRVFLESLSEDALLRIEKVTTKAEEPSVSRMTSPLGVDVTDSFQRAYDEGFRVYRNPAGKHQVTKANDIKKPITLQPLEAAEVEPFVDRWLSEEGGSKKKGK